MPRRCDEGAKSEKRCHKVQELINQRPSARISRLRTIENVMGDDEGILSCFLIMMHSFCSCSNDNDYRKK